MPAIIESGSRAQTVQDMPKDLPTLIELEAQKFFAASKFNNAEVVTWSDMANEFPDDTSIFGIFQKFIKKFGKNSSFFVDEYHEGYWKSEWKTVPPTQLPSLVISS